MVTFIAGPSGVLRMVSNPQPIVGQGIRPLVRHAGIELRHAHRLDQPPRLEGRHLPRLAGGKLVVAAVIHAPAAGCAASRTRTTRRCCRGRVPCRSGRCLARRRNRRGRSKATLAPSEGKPGPLTDAVRRERMDLRAVPVDHLDDLLQRGRGRQHRGSGWYIRCNVCGQLAPLSDSTPVQSSNSQSGEARAVRRVDGASIPPLSVAFRLVASSSMFRP